MELETRVGRRERPKHRWWRAALLRLRQRRKRIIILLLLAGIAYGGYRVARSIANREPLEVTLRKASRQAVLISLRDDIKLNVNFSDDVETTIDPQAGGKYSIHGWVDLTTQAGATYRQSYSCILFRNAEGQWMADQISVIPQ